MALKSFTIKIGADTKDFNKGLRDADKAIKSTIKEGNALKESLKLNFDQKKFEAAQKNAQHALDLTNQKANALREQLKLLEDAGAIDSDNYYELSTKLATTEIQAEKLKKDLEDINNLKFTRLSTNFDNLSAKLVKAGKATAGLSLAAAGTLVGMYKLATSAVEAGDEIETLADKYNLSAVQIQKWSYIAMQSDVASEQLYKGITKARDAIGTALVGETNNATNALEKLFGDLSKIPTDSEGAFETIILQLSQVEDSTLQAYYANEIFGERLATELIPLIRKGAGALKEFNDEFEEVGYLSNEQVKNLSEVDNELNKMKQELTNAKNELGMALLPILRSLTDFVTGKLVPAIKQVAEWFAKLPSGIQNIIFTGLTLLAVLSPILLIGGKIVGLAGSLIKSLPSLTSLISKLGTTTGRTLITVAAIASVIMMINDIVNNWASMNTWQKIISILGVVTVAALGAAVAFGAFHSAWSLGLAVAGIVAGIAAVTAAVNSAKNSIDSDIQDVSSPNIFSGNSSGTSYSNSGSSVPSYDVISGSNYNTVSSSNDTYNIDINMNSTGSLDYDARQLASEVIKQIQVAKQSSGR